MTAFGETVDPKLLSDRQEKLFYDPIKPEESILFDTLPGAPEFNDKGQIISTKLGLITYANLVLPLLTIIISGKHIWMQFIV